MHHVLSAADMKAQTPPIYMPHSAGFTRVETCGAANGAVHIGFGLCALEHGGWISAHVHSFEESFYVLEGEVFLTIENATHKLAPGDCGLIPVGAPHAWRASDGEPARWLEMLAPTPRVAGPADTFFTGDPAPAPGGAPVDARDPRSRSFFHLRERDMNLDALKRGAPVDEPTVSASMASALLAYSGIAVKMLVDQRMGAALHTMFMVEYEPGGVAQPHDHPLEESYFLLDGEVDAVADGERFTLRAGDAMWTGVGCVHAFYNTSSEKVRWLETSSPQPPARHSYRFDRDWDYLAAAIAASRS